MAGHGERVLEVDHADDLVEAVAVDGEAGEARGAGEVEDVLGGGRGLQGADLHPRGHHVLGGQPAQGQGPYEEVGGVLLERARPGRVAGEGDEFAGGAGGGQLLGGLHAQGSDEPVGDRVQQGDDGAEEVGEDALRAGDEPRDLQRPGDGPVLGHQLADDHLHGGGQQHAGHDRGARRRGGGQPGGREGAGEQPAEGGLGEHADHQGSDGDAQLGSGELEGELAQRRDHGPGPRVAVGRGPLGLGLLDGHETELRGDEESVRQDEEQGCREQQ